MACSSVIACNLFRITSKVIGSIFGVCNLSSMLRLSARPNGNVSCGVQPRGLSGGNKHRGFRMLDHRRPFDHKIRRKLAPLVDRRFHPAPGDWLEDLAVGWLGRCGGRANIKFRTSGSTEGFDSRVGEFYARFAERRALAVGHFVALLEALYQRL